jgi:CheY-like chemotaxis protein
LQTQFGEAGLARILVVDDDLPMRRLLHEYLTEAGHSVTQASEASEAILILLRRDFDVIVTDVQMPYLDGLHLADAIKKDPKTAHIPVVVLTGSVEDSVSERVSSLGARLINKSASMDEVVRQITMTVTRATGMPGARLT